MGGPVWISNNGVFLHEGNKWGLIFLIPSCHCGTGCMYCQAGCHGNNCKEGPYFPPWRPLLYSFFPLFFFFLFCPAPCQISFSFTLLLQLVQTRFAEFWVGNVQVCICTHTQRICLSAAGEAGQGTMSLKKRLSFKRTWIFSPVSK